MENFFIGLLVKPLLLLFFIFWIALGVHLVRRYAPTAIKQVLLRKLW
jgi:hypothetical protein